MATSTPSFSRFDGAIEASSMAPCVAHRDPCLRRVTKASFSSPCPACATVRSRARSSTCAPTARTARWASSSTSAPRKSSSPSFWCSSTSSARPRRSACRPAAEAVRVLRGGPVDTGRGFVLHSSDYRADEFDRGDRRRRLPDGDARHPARDRQGVGAAQGGAGARLRRLGVRPVGERNPRQRLAGRRPPIRG